MPRRARRRTLDSITFRIELTGEDITRWQFAADDLGVPIEQMVRDAVESLMVAPRKRTLAG